MSTTAPYGSWASPLGADDTVVDIVSFSDLQCDGEALYWLESRPSEAAQRSSVAPNVGRTKKCYPTP